MFEPTGELELGMTVESDSSEEEEDILVVPKKKQKQNTKKGKENKKKKKNDIEWKKNNRFDKKILNGKVAKPINEYPELDGFNPYKTKLLKCWYIKLTSMQTETQII